MELGKDANQAYYYVAALDIGATECRLAVQLIDEAHRPVGSVKVYVQRQIEMGEGFVSNIEVTSRVVGQVAGHMSKLLGFDVKKMAVIYMVGSTETKNHTHSVRCTEQKPGTSSKIVTGELIGTLHDQATKWKDNEEASDDWLVVYNQPVEYYTKEKGIKRMRGNPVGTFTDQIYSDYLSVKVRKEYADRFNAVLLQSGIAITNYYLEGVATPCVQKEVLLRKGKDLYLHLGHSKSVLSEVFAGKNDELQISHYAWLPGIGTEFSIEYAKQNHDCSQEFVYERLQQDVQFELVNLQANEFQRMVESGHFKNVRNAQITGNAMNALGRLVMELTKVLNEWYPHDNHIQKRFCIHLSGGIAGLAGIDKLMLRCLQLAAEERVESIDLVDLSMSYDVLSDQSDGQARDEALCSVLGVLGQEILRNEESLIIEEPIEKPEAIGADVTQDNEQPSQDEPQVVAEGESESQGKKSLFSRVQSIVKDILQGPTKPIV